MHRDNSPQNGIAHHLGKWRSTRLRGKACSPVFVGITELVGLVLLATRGSLVFLWSVSATFGEAGTSLEVGRFVIGWVGLAVSWPLTILSLAGRSDLGWSFVDSCFHCSKDSGCGVPIETVGFTADFSSVAALLLFAPMATVLNLWLQFHQSIMPSRPDLQDLVTFQGPCF